jgi:3-dehydroquinate synthase
MISGRKASIPQRILLTGAQGFLGRYLSAYLLRKHPQAEILGIGRSPAIHDGFTHALQWGTRGLRAPLPDELKVAFTCPRVHYASLDLARQSDLTGMLGDFQPHWIFHLASGLRDDPPDHLFRTNVEGTINLIEAVRESGMEIPRLVLGSTGFLYGRVRPEQLPIREDSACTPIDLYGASKLAAEHASRILSSRYEIPTLWARIFNLVGPGQDERHLCGRLTSQTAAIAAGVIPPIIEVEPLTSSRDFLDVRDAAQALELLATKGSPGWIYNVASGIEARVDQVFDAIVRHAGLDGKVEIDLRPPRPADIPRYVADVGRLLSLGFTPAYSLDQSLRDLRDYYRGPVAAAADGRRGWSGRSKISASVEADCAYRYAVEIEAGLLETLPQRLGALYPGARMVIVTDPRVFELYGAGLVKRLCAGGIRADVALLSEGEHSKSPTHYLSLIERLHQLHFDRRAVLVNLGGGIVTDVGGFVAASYMRGVAYVNVPTTLLAQLDAAIGGKVAVNMPWAKNFVGAFAHPRAVFCDPSLLATLNAREISAGVAEALKIGIIGDPYLFELLERESVAVRGGQDANLLGEVVARACEGKIAMLAGDPYERNLRRVLNLGHTFGHALEVQTRYEELLHGEAVGFGLAVATAVAYHRRLCSGNTLERIFRALDAYGLPPSAQRSDLLAACSRLEEIRLVRAGKLNFVLPVEVGRVEIVPEVSDDEIMAAVELIAAHPVIGRSVKDSSCEQSASMSGEVSYSPA